VKPFAFAAPETLEQLLELLSGSGPATRLLAGGTDLIVRLRSGHARPERLVDIKRVHGLSREIEQVDGALRFGARVTMRTITSDARVRRHFPALVEAAMVVGSVQIRNRATLAGNICNASPAADTAPALLVYGAHVNVIGPGGTRRVPLAGFFIGPGRTVLQPAELVSSIDLPIPAEPTGAAFARVTRRRGVDLATINLCALVNDRGESRFAFGAVAPTPVLAVDGGAVVAAAGARAADLSAAIRPLFANTSPISDVRGSREYRTAMLEVMTRRVLASALERLRSKPGREEARS
jgi:CO/xanthine dehydrogenase FAD-binding subunit